jgi:hypothetical protein
MHVAARRKELRALVVASRYLTDVVLKLRIMNDEESLAHRQAMNVIEGWAIDPIKTVGNSGTV